MTTTATLLSTTAPAIPGVSVPMPRADGAAFATLLVNGAAPLSVVAGEPGRQGGAPSGKTLPGAAAIVESHDGADATALAAEPLSWQVPATLPLSPPSSALARTKLAALAGQDSAPASASVLQDVDALLHDKPNAAPVSATRPTPTPVPDPVPEAGASAAPLIESSPDVRTTARAHAPRRFEAVRAPSVALDPQASAPGGADTEAVPGPVAPASAEHALSDDETASPTLPTPDAAQPWPQAALPTDALPSLAPAPVTPSAPQPMAAAASPSPLATRAAVATMTRSGADTTAPGRDGSAPSQVVTDAPVVSTATAAIPLASTVPGSRLAPTPALAGAAPPVHLPAQVPAQVPAESRRATVGAASDTTPPVQLPADALPPSAAPQNGAAPPPIINHVQGAADAPIVSTTTAAIPLASTLPGSRPAPTPASAGAAPPVHFPVQVPAQVPAESRRATVGAASDTTPPVQLPADAFSPSAPPQNGAAPPPVMSIAQVAAGATVLLPAAAASVPEQPIAAQPTASPASITTGREPMSAPSEQRAAPARLPDAAPTPLPPAAPPAAAPAAQVFAAALHRFAETQDDARRGDGDARTLASALPLTATQATAAVAATMPADARLDMGARHWPETMIARITALRDASDALAATAAVGSDHARIRLSPDALGSVEVSLRRDEDRVHVEIVAERPQARALLAEAQPRLTELAEQRGVRLTHAGAQTAADTGQNTGQSPQQAPARAPLPTTNRRAADAAEGDASEGRVA